MAKNQKGLKWYFVEIFPKRASLFLPVSPSIKRCLANQDGWETKKLMEFCLKTLGADKKSCYWSDIRKRCKNIIVTVIIGVILIKDVKTSSLSLLLQHTQACE